MLEPIFLLAILVGFLCFGKYIFLYILAYLNTCIQRFKQKRVAPYELREVLLDHVIVVNPNGEMMLGLDKGG